MLNPLGHWADGKAEAVVQARGIGLARHGYVALLFDPIGQGERSQVWDTATNTNPMVSSTEQHADACLPCWLIGQTVINHMLWDGVRMLDYLEMRSDVDSSRIGCTGASGGGTYTMFLTAFDDRIKAAVPVCSTATYERMHSKGQIGDPCQDPAGSYPNDLEMADLLMSRAPLPMQITSTTYDFFPLIGARDVYAEVLDCYSALGVPERANMVEAPAHHDYNQPMREAMYAWFNRWLKDEPGAVTEAPFTPESPETLWCTTSGQAILSDRNETVVSLNDRRVEELAPALPSLAKKRTPNGTGRTFAKRHARCLITQGSPQPALCRPWGHGLWAGYRLRKCTSRARWTCLCPAWPFIRRVRARILQLSMSMVAARMLKPMGLALPPNWRVPGAWSLQWTYAAGARPAGYRRSITRPAMSLFWVLTLASRTWGTSLANGR